MRVFASASDGDRQKGFGPDAANGAPSAMVAIKSRTVAATTTSTAWAVRRATNRPTTSTSG